MSTAPANQYDLSIGEVARRAGVRASAVRYYERAGLIRVPRRAGGRRVYDESVFETLALVQLAQDAGFTISEIKQLLNGFDRVTPASARWRTLSRRKRDEMITRIADAQRMLDVLERLSRCRCEKLRDCVWRRVVAMAARERDPAPLT
jgi:MerR family redox-sensitive transcriptional activator SoxR